jgi:hypothetical protein
MGGHMALMEKIENAYKIFSREYWREENTWETKVLMGGQY